MAKAKAPAKKSSSSKRGPKEPIVEIDGVSVKKADLDKIPVGKTFSVASSEKVEELKAAEKDQIAASFEARAVADEPAANVQYTSDPNFPPPSSKPVRIGMTVIALPSAEKQLAGFYSEHAGRLAKIKAYKLIQPKG